MSKQAVNIVWFKRDLRLADHQALTTAANDAGSVLPLVVVEPEYWALPDTSYRHYQYQRRCIKDLAQQIHERHGELNVRTGDVVDVLSDLKSHFANITLYSHQETGNHWTYQRDQRVRQWCRDNAVSMREYKQFGVWRGRELDRDNWAKRWDAMMAEPVSVLPDNIQWISSDSQALPTAKSLGLSNDGIQDLQTPGRAAGLELLDSFLFQRGKDYRSEMSSPISGEHACSRLSTHIAYGSLSMREIYQAVDRRITELRAMSAQDRRGWLGSMSAYNGRLHWHCHFMQKLETEPEIEWLPMARAYTDLRPQTGQDDKLKAFADGQTGFPFVDACMRYLRAHGWINFRMRAMLQSFASYNLWLRWQDSGRITAKLYTDYEPGIHWTQTQMQSGETGINTLRIYSPVKQGYDQDPEGTFVRRWVPELSNIEDEYLQEPWKSDTKAAYPDPIVDHIASAKSARAAIGAIRKTPEAKAEAEQVYERHGSRRRPSKRSSKRDKATS